MAIEDVTPEVRIEGGDEVVAEFQKMAASAVDSFAKIAKAAEGMGDVGKHVSEASEAGKKSLGELGIIGAEAFGKILDAAGSGNFVPVIGMFSKTAAAIAEVVQKASEFVESQAQVIETLSALGDATGMSLSQIEGLKDAFASVGISANGFERSIGRLAITISNDWSSIQQAVRTSSDQQTSAMLHVQETTFAVSKAYNAMSEAVDNASRSAAHSAQAIESASLGLRQAMNDLNDFGLKSQQNSLSVEGATLSLKRAQLNLLKDQGYDVSAAEKTLKLETDKVAVKEAELKLTETRNKKEREGLELEELQLKVKKAKQEADDAEHKAIEESIKSSERLRDAQLAIQKAQLANREAQEKQHEMDLKDIPAIARELENVAGGYKKWDEVMNHAEVSAQNLTKAVILSASAGDITKQPTALSVFEKMVELFPKISDEGTKLALVQHTMGAGFRAGQASAAQLLAILDRGPEALKAFIKEADAFSHVKIGGFDTFVDEAARARGEVSNTEKAVKSFQGALSGLEAAIDSVKNRFAAILAEPLTELFDTMKNSIYDDDGALRKFADTLGDALVWIVKVATALAQNDALKAFGMLILRVGELVYDFVGAIGSLIGGLLRLVGLDGPAKFFERMALVVDLLKLSMDGLRLMIAGVVIGFGLMAAAADKAKSMLPGQTAKSWEQAKADSPMLQQGDQMAKEVNEDIKKDMKAFEEAGKKLDASADSGKKAADDSDKAADKSSKASDKHDKAADKHDKAADHEDGAASKLADAGSHLIDAADKLEEAAEKLTGGSGGTRKADGGYISGPGTATSDSIPAMLSDGEYVMRAASVAQYGKSFFDAVNKGVAKFSEGGFVDSDMHRDKHGQYIGPVRFGAATETALMDTGATFTSIGRALAEQAGIDLANATKSSRTTANGNIDALEVMIPVSVHGVSRLLPGDVLPELEKPLLGMNFLNSLTDFAMTKTALLLKAAGGGHIRGAGTATSDSIPARLSDGEYVVRAAAVSQYGVPLFDALNNLALGGGARFAMGGAVGARGATLPTSMASEGPHSILNLAIDGNHFNGLKAPEAVASKLKSYAVGRQTSSAQNMPTWMR